MKLPSGLPGSLVAAATVAAIAVLVRERNALVNALGEKEAELGRARGDLGRCEESLSVLHARLEKNSLTFAALAPAPNPPFVLAEFERVNANPPVMTADDSIDRLERNWTLHLNRTTPMAYQRLPSDVNCNNGKDVVVDIKEFKANETTAAGKAARALVECGFVFLDNAAPREQVQQYADAYERFLGSPESNKFKYPIQGKGRFEHMIPFAPPFNTTLHLNGPLHATLNAFLQGSFKMELQTVINSPPGSGNQRWHQGWRYLWHEEERTPPYTVVVGIPLSDVTLAMGPTEFCPRKKLRLYHGYHCPDKDVVAAETTMGTIAVFDYKTLHRGPGNTSNTSRPMVSLVYSLKWFLNSYAYANRALTNEAVLHQRRYWAAYMYHPDKEELLWQV